MDDLSPEDRLHILRSSGACLRELGEFTEAVQRYQEGLAIDPNDIAFFCIAWQRASPKRGGRRKGWRTLDQALKLQPDAWRPVARVGETLQAFERDR